ncbi:hypothetical protein [Rhizohabitans arisaemae]|uniref:hypothetical protein n=1 Tax=Rhizohabitans arisaemae TaxID=2720610 RepID=UPI0024B0E8F4|nr:hypothetical protein [Rhizohabitans arisaemae]
MQSRWLRTLALTALIGGTGFVTMGAAAPQSQVAPIAAPQQAANFTDYQLIKLPNANVPNFQRRTVWCPAGKRAIGGGAEAQGNEAVLVGSFPTDDGRGWIGIGRQPGYRDVGISVFVICATVS